MEDQDRIAKDFVEAVNMQPAELETWLESDESQSVGWTKEGEDKSVGRRSGRRIVEIKRKKRADLDDDDYAHMRKVVGYVHRHMAQRPSGDVKDSRWGYSLMNWGHDRLK